MTSVPAWKQELLEKRRLNDEEIQRRKDEEIRRLQVHFIFMKFLFFIKSLGYL